MPAYLILFNCQNSKLNSIKAIRLNTKQREGKPECSAVPQILYRKIIGQTEEFQVILTYTFLAFPILN